MNGLRRHGCQRGKNAQDMNYELEFFNIQPVWMFKYHIEIGKKDAFQN